MKRNGRFSLALHTLGHMAAEPQKVSTSSEIAKHAGTNPVVVRRVLGPLREAGLVTSEKGHAGGWLLARPAAEISLADVYSALGEKLFGQGDTSDKPDCAVEHMLQRHVSDILGELEATLVQRLSQTTLADIN